MAAGLFGGGPPGAAGPPEPSGESMKEGTVNACNALWLGGDGYDEDDDYEDDDYDEDDDDW